MEHSVAGVTRQLRILTNHRRFRRRCRNAPLSKKLSVVANKLPLVAAGMYTSIVTPDQRHTIATLRDNSSIRISLHTAIHSAGFYGKSIVIRYYNMINVRTVFTDGDIGMLKAVESYCPRAKNG